MATTVARSRTRPGRLGPATGSSVRARLARMGHAQAGRQPGPGAAVPRRTREPPEGRPGAAGARLPDRGAAARRPDAAAAVTPYITHPLAVTTILADIGMTEPTLVAVAAPRHGRGHGVHPRRAALRVRRRGGPAGRRRDQAGQGQVRRLGAVGDHPQDDRRDEQGHPGARDQARRPAAQHAHAALPQAGDPGAQVPRDARDLRAAGPPARHEHPQVGARGPRLRHHAPQDLRRDRAAGRRAGAVARPVPGRGDQPGRGRPQGREDQGHGDRAARSTTTRSTRR